MFLPLYLVRIKKKSFIFVSENLFNRTNPVRERMAEATAVGSVYQRSHCGKRKRSGRERWCKDGEWKAWHIMQHRDMLARWHGCRPMIGTGQEHCSASGRTP